MTDYTRTCSVEACDRPHFGKGLCNAHYSRLRRHGDLGTPQVVVPQYHPCSVGGCERTSVARDLCKLHYDRWKKRGVTDTYVPPSPVERFWTYVNQTDTCWLWIGGCNIHGYGQFASPEGNVGAHRFAYETLVGPIPEGLDLDHLCRVRCCVNPSHLEPVTRQENLRRGREARCVQA